MIDEKRMVGDYEVKNSFRIGGKEVLLGENPALLTGGKYACGYAERNDLFERYSEFVVSDDYIEIAEEYAKRIQKQIEQVKSQLPAEKEYRDEITAESCIETDHTHSIKGEVVVIKPEKLRPEYRGASYQICYVTGGFGAEANARGQSVFCTEIYSGESARYDRSSIMGVIKPKCMPNWAKNRLLIIKKDESVFEFNGRHYIPYRQLKGKELLTTSKNICSEGITDNYSSKSFYDKSTNIKADLFLCLENDKLYIPGENELFAWNGDKGVKNYGLVSVSHKKRDHESR